MVLRARMAWSQDDVSALFARAAVVPEEADIAMPAAVVTEMAWSPRTRWALFGFGGRAGWA
jgi:hypothetical protein